MHTLSPQQLCLHLLEKVRQLKQQREYEEHVRRSFPIGGTTGTTASNTISPNQYTVTNNPEPLSGIDAQMEQLKKRETAAIRITAVQGAERCYFRSIRYKKRR